MTFTWATLQINALANFIEQVATEYDALYQGSAHVILMFPDAMERLSAPTLDLLRTASVDGSTKRRQLREYEQLLLQMVYTRTVDNFLTYLAQLMALIHNTRPETLRSSQQQVTLEEVLQHGTMEELVAAQTEKRVQELSYLGMQKLADDLKRRGLKFDLFPKREDAAEAVRIVEIRNIVVHNRAVVNNTFLSRIPGTTYQCGEGVNFVGGHEILPVGGHENPHWRP